MTDDKIRQVVKMYQMLLDNRGATPERIADVSYATVRLDDSSYGKCDQGMLEGHCAHACVEILKFVAEGRREKAFRWLGWLQCALWVIGIIPTISDGVRDNIAEPPLKPTATKVGAYRHYKGGLYQVLGVADGDAPGHLAAGALVLGVARHTETEELLMVRVGVIDGDVALCVSSLATGERVPERVVVYVALTGAHMPGSRICVRPEAMFCEDVEVGCDGGLDHVCGPGCDRRVPRFEYVGDEIPEALRPVAP